jgi:hypothetical protein
MGDAPGASLACRVRKDCPHANFCLILHGYLHVSRFCVQVHHVIKGDLLVIFACLLGVKEAKCKQFHRAMEAGQLPGPGVIPCFFD